MGKVISLPKRRRGPTASKRREGARQRKLREALDKLGELIDPGGFIQREIEGDHNLQALQRGFMASFQRAFDRGEKARKASRKGKGKEG
ncbi:MAG: hypothetical protein V3W10_00635 [candidate division NC10 bacterium]